MADTTRVTLGEIMRHELLSWPVDSTEKARESEGGGGGASKNHTKWRYYEPEVFFVVVVFGVFFVVVGFLVLVF